MRNVLKWGKMKLDDKIREKGKKLLSKGKISLLNPDKIERQSILNFLINNRSYVRGLLLDIGCGQKPYQSIFDPVNGYIGMDLPQTSHSIGDKNIDVAGNILSLPFKSESFDTVLSTQVIEHVSEPKKVLEEVHRVLRSGGYLILTAPMTWGLHDEPHDYYRFTKYGLKYIAESAGFEVVFIEARTGFWGMIGQKLSTYIYYFKGEPSLLFSEIIKRILCGFIQLFFIFLDKINKKEWETLGYGLVARKRG